MPGPKPNPPLIIKQLMPAPDWFAVYDSYGTPENPKDLEFVPLVGWAVIHNYLEDGEDHIVPMIQTHDFGVIAADDEGMIGIVHTSQRGNVEEWIKRRKPKPVAPPIGFGDRG